MKIHVAYIGLEGIVMVGANVVEIPIGLTDVVMHVTLKTIQVDLATIAPLSI